MDPVTTAIIAATVTSVSSAASKTVIVDAYDTLKALLEKKYGTESDIVKSVKSLEAKPESAARKDLLQEEVIVATADQDPDILRAAQEVLKYLSAQPSGVQGIQQAIGNSIAQADRGSTASVSFNYTPRSNTDV